MSSSIRDHALEILERVWLKHQASEGRDLQFVRDNLEAPVPPLLFALAKLLADEGLTVASHNWLNVSVSYYDQKLNHAGLRYEHEQAIQKYFELKQVIAQLVKQNTAVT